MTTWYKSRLNTGSIHEDSSPSAAMESITDFSLGNRRACVEKMISFLVMLTMFGSHEGG